ncbi:hypothetical protein KY386_03085 [Candidatus Parcubacteria bacterium]|nr:hypothetical protein [Candidatus Parcubacteria bacterium]
MKSKYKVMVDDNYHYMDESERYQAGAYSSVDEAVKECRRIVDEFLESTYKPGMTAKELYQSYTGFGDDPFIVPTHPSKAAEFFEFSAWDYAKERCDKIAHGKSHDSLK